LSAAFFFFLELAFGLGWDVRQTVGGKFLRVGADAESSERISVASVDPALFSATKGTESIAESDAGVFHYERAASASSGSSMVMVTSARPSGRRLVVH